MSAVEVTVSGVLFDKQNRTVQNVVLIGEATLTGLGVGGGPMPPGPGSPGQPPSIWPSPGHPAHPIVLPPEQPPGGGQPPSIWPNPPEGIAPHPEHPIVLPEPPDKPPEPIAPPVSWKAVWHPTEGWIVVGVISPEIEHPVPS